MSDSILYTSNPDAKVQKAVHSPTSLASAGNLNPNPRSCVICRRRKVKCDKKQPCSNCARAKSECIFPGPGRAPRKSRRPPDGELMDRLRRLEGVVQNLNAQVEEHEQEAAERERPSSSSVEAASGMGEGAEEACPTRAREERTSVVVDNSVEGLETRFGRLVVDQGRSRYINNSFWASLNNEVEDLKSILIEHGSEEDTHDSPDTSTSQQSGFIFGYSSSNVDMLSLHPAVERAREYWSIYKQNVDPLVKVLHIPTFEPVLLDAVQHPESVPKSIEPLMFAIYYGSVTSTMPEDCIAKWGETRDELLNKYRFGLEQALSRANFLYCDEMIILQAFVVFMILLRRNDDARKIWTLTGLAVRIAQTLGIHRDGSHFHLKPFEIEMRRRLWWQVCILDARASEDHGCDPTIIEAQFDTRMPLNINDVDINPDMTQFPKERQGFTDMTFCLIRFEVTNIFRRILYVPPGPTRCNQFFSNLTVPEKERWISDCHQRLEDKYLKGCDMSIPLCWITATISRLIMSKMWLIVYHPHQRKDGGASLPQETKDKLFVTSLENIEYSILIETEARTMQWGWLFRTYVQWHAIAFLLSELCVRTKGEAVERAWRALDATAGRWWFPLGDTSVYAKGQAGCLWRPLRKLMAKARAARGRELALERASQALRSGGVFYSDFPILLDKILAEAPIGNQPSPDKLDGMLRPEAPKLGQMPVASPPTWNQGLSPLINNINYSQLKPGQSPNSIIGKLDNTSDEGMNGGGNGIVGNMSQLDVFNGLQEHGLDFLVGDVMDGYAPDGSAHSIVNPNHDPHSAFRSPNFTAHPLPLNQDPNLANLANSTSRANMTNGSAMSNINQNFPQTPINMNMNGGFNGSPTSGLGSGANGGTGVGSNEYSPVLEYGNAGTGELGAEMDWAIWDDMVSQFGMDGVIQQSQTGNAAGHLGKVGWF
ncbi:hypothetical protein P280DRAFT_470847 [Massarina eburnea CBS 473.64]|uniref:Zn(2)-C6 fungal-type domain-containing protein n=1 Tax=Massarina eburnea CBS 473.64 TaxID=1395130 RepID=A0A6A6RX93_9PLEO|nr:hypothetical protein P280DRAFT_470847 [Massarina eburnea CBS 473.64]